MNGHIRKRSNNSLQLIYELPRDAVGRRQQGRQTVHGTKKGAITKLREILASLDKGNYVAPTQETVVAFLENGCNPMRPRIRASELNNTTEASSAAT